MATINILVTVNGESLASQVANGSIPPGRETSPTGLGSFSSSNAFISMVAPIESVNNSTQGQSELDIRANIGDTLSWSISTIDNNDSQTPQLYNGQFNPSSAMSQMNFYCVQAKTYLAQGSPPASSPVEYVNQVSSVSSQILQGGVKIQYTLSFILVNNATGETIGYFSWDPFITVN